MLRVVRAPMSLSGENFLSWVGNKCAYTPEGYPNQKEGLERKMLNDLLSRKLAQAVFLEFSLEGFPVNTENVCRPVFVTLLGIQDF